MIEFTNSRDYIIQLMSKNIYDYKKGIISFRINGVMKPYFYYPDKIDFEKMKAESNKMRCKQENPLYSLAKLLKPIMDRV